MELISREDAIKCLDGNVLITRQSEAEAVKEYFEMVIAKLKALPTIEERKEGHWIDTGENLHKCTNCGHIIFSQTRYDLEEFHAYCGRCGARMKGE